MKIGCLICNDILDSATFHGFVECKCGACHIDNIGNNLTRIGRDFTKIITIKDDAQKKNYFQNDLTNKKK